MNLPHLKEDKHPTISNKPCVSIGMPVFNAENYLREALDALLSQTFSDFELIISDNASTDATEEICREYTSKDCRIKYYRNQTNIGAAGNFNRVFQLSSGKYFKWAAHDDICAPEFLKRCVEVLEQDASVVLCYPQARIIDEHGIALQDYDIKLNISSSKPHERFHDLTCIHHRCYQVFGVIRASTLRMTPLIGNYATSDRVLLARLALFGRLYEIPEFLFFPRRHRQQSVEMLYQPKQKHRRLHQYAVWFDPANKGRILLPNWRILREYLIAIKSAPLTFYEQARCYLQIGVWLNTHWNFAKLGRDLILAAIQFFEQFSMPIQKLENTARERRDLA